MKVTLVLVFLALIGAPLFVIVGAVTGVAYIEYTDVIEGFFSLGTLAGELEQPRRTFIVSIAILFPTVLLLNTVPLAVALGLDDRPEHYSAGYFNVLAGRLAGSWLDWSFQLGANVCLVGLYNAAVLTATLHQGSATLRDVALLHPGGTQAPAQ